MSRPATDSANNTAVYVVCAVIGAGAAYASFSSYGLLTGFQIFSLLLSLVISVGAYFFLGKGPFKGGVAATLAVFGVYCAVTAAVFYPTAGNIFRSDDWLLLALFDSVSGFSVTTGLRQRCGLIPRLTGIGRRTASSFSAIITRAPVPWFTFPGFTSLPTARSLPAKTRP